MAKNGKNHEKSQPGRMLTMPYPSCISAAKLTIGEFELVEIKRCPSPLNKALCDVLHDIHFRKWCLRTNVVTDGDKEWRLHRIQKKT
jgi:hypothetical protein